MSVQITTAFVDQFKDGVDLLVQQKGSHLRRAVRTETVNGESAFFDQVGSVGAVKVTSRHADTPILDVPHARRRVTVESYRWGALIDKEDQIRILNDPTSMYAQAAAYSMGRSIDQAIIDAADGTAYTGQDGSTTTSYDANMTVDVQVRWPGVVAADYGLNAYKILTAAERLGSNNVDPADEKWLVLNPRQTKSLLSDTHVSSFDYNVLKPLVEGQIVRWGGFNIVSTTLIGVDGNADDKVLYWAGKALLLGLGQDIMARITERADKGFAMQVYYSMTIGATRMEEARVGYIECDPTAGPGV